MNLFDGMDVTCPLLSFVLYTIEDVLRNPLRIPDVVFVDAERLLNLFDRTCGCKFTVRKPTGHKTETDQCHGECNGADCRELKHGQ